MKQFIGIAAWFVVGYWVASKAIPAVQAKIEAMDLDQVWEVWDSEEWM